MGSLKNFNLPKIIAEYNIRYLIETGTWKGDGVAYAKQFRFEKILSTEIVPSIANAAKERFKNSPKIEILTGNSIDIFKQRLPNLNGNCLFWLDAHFPGAEEKINGYNDYADEDVKLPLKKEIELIRSLRKNHHDVILIDDLRIYEEGPYESGNMPEDILRPSEKNIDFIFQEFGNTHNIVRSYVREGYLIVTPKNKRQSNPLSPSQLLFKARSIFKKIVY